TAKAEAQRRSVQLDRAENDMGWLTAYLPATDVAAVWGVVDDMAHQLRHTTGEDRTLSQLRADSLTGIITGRLLPADRFTDTADGTGIDTGTDGGTTTDGVVHPDGDGDPDGDGSADAGADAPAATSAPAGSDAPPGTDGSTDHETERGIDGTEIANVNSDGADRDGGAHIPVCTCGGRAPVVQQVVQETVQVVRITPTRPVVRVTIPASVLLSLDDAPGNLDGYGPIPAETARLIATDATWQRLLTDPVTGILTDYSTTTYQPGKVLRGAVEARDGTCTFGWCDTPANRCDLDHIEPFDHDHDPATFPPGTPGQTRAQNLQPLCRKHHLLKTHAGWGVVRDPTTGITTWTTPTGRTHTRPPTVLDTHINLDQIDPDTSHDLTLQALTGQRLPRQYTTTEPGAVPADPTNADPANPDQPPF
ncbi:hypothetical protein C8K30_114169, partial [Promicromonospora sp. AC04]|uniref:HNH endonuclease signature motif containing protein n=1 Tax=Promicromonospora sp. AC04 TaxID=2135723 RepID=UPI000D4FB4E2